MMRQHYTTGEIVNVDLGKPPDAIKGLEQALIRPCLIIKPFDHLELAIVIPCTTKKPKYGYYTIVSLPKGAGGLLRIPMHYVIRSGQFPIKGF